MPLLWRNLGNVANKRVIWCTAAFLVAAGGLLVAPIQVAQAVPAGSPQCNATGGTIAASGSYFKHTFTANGTFTPKQTMTVEYLVVGGGGGGGGVTTRRMAGGGAGGGQVATSTSQVLTGGTGYTITVGGGGAGGSGSTVGTTGSSSVINTVVTSVGGGGGGAGITNTNGANGAGGGGGGGATGASTGGTGSPGTNGAAGFVGANTTRAAGGGGGMSVAGSAGAADTGGAGGAGTANSTSGSSVTYGGGGGGGAGTTGGSGGSGGGGSGGTSGALPGTAGTANTGGGGGGAGNSTVNGETAKSGGAGGTGIVIIRYLKNAGCPSIVQSLSFTSPTLSWSAPATIPSGQTISSYTVVYRLSSRTGSDGWAIYARSGTATSLNITGTTTATCGSNNASPWSCVLGDGALVSGTTYSFSVFAKTSTTAFSRMATSVNYLVP